MITNASKLGGLDIIPFGIPELDMLTKMGGVPSKKIGEIFGKFSIGKTTLCYYLVRSAQEMDKNILWVDVERSLTTSVDREYPEILGIDSENFPIMHEDHAEDYFDEIEKWVRANKDGLIVMDSLGMLNPRTEGEKASGESAPAARARLVDVFCRQMKPLISMNNHALVFINHMYNPMDFGGTGRNARFPDIQAAGGKRLEYAKDWSILLEETWQKDDEDKLLKLSRLDGTKGGKYVKAKMWKNKMKGTQYEEAVFALTVGQGVMKDWNLKRLAEKAGTITKEGNTYYAFSEKIGTKAKLAEWLKVPENTEKIKEALKNT